MQEPLDLLEPLGFLGVVRDQLLATHPRRRKRVKSLETLDAVIR
jgi:hypothetical protein